MDRLKALEFEGIKGWINSNELKLSDLIGKVVFLDFWTYTCINCRRTLPHLKRFYNKYKKYGFVLIGIHTPEFSFERERNWVEKAKEIQAHFIQAHFIDSTNTYENKFYLENGFLLDKKWYYLETTTQNFGIPDLPKGYRWVYLENYEIIRKWVKCYNEAFKEHYGMRPLRINELKSYYKEEGFDPTGYFGIYDEEKNLVIGECSCEIDPLFNKYKKIKRGIIWTLGVLKEYRGKGFGKKLLRKAFNWFHSKGIERIAIHVEEDNKAAYDLYSKHGFEIKRYRLFYTKSIF